MKFPVLIFLFSFLVPSFGLAKESVVVKFMENEIEYKESHALIIGNNDYFVNLKESHNDVDIISEEMKKRGFTISKFKDVVDSKKLEKILTNFISTKGQEKDARLFIWITVHGKTLYDEDNKFGKGYLVLKDTPLLPKKLTENPTKNEKNDFNKKMKAFKEKAFPMETLRDILEARKSKHAVVFLKACYSGKLLSDAKKSYKRQDQKALPAKNNMNLDNRVLYIFTAGGGKQEVDDSPSFRNLFLEALEESGKASNGVIGASHIGKYISERYVDSNTPQVDTSALSKGGEFYFVNPKFKCVENESPEFNKNIANLFNPIANRFINKYKEGRKLYDLKMADTFVKKAEEYSKCLDLTKQYREDVNKFFKAIATKDNDKKNNQAREAVTQVDLAIKEGRFDDAIKDLERANQGDKSQKKIDKYLQFMKDFEIARKKRPVQLEYLYQPGFDTGLWETKAGYYVFRRDKTLNTNNEEKGFKQKANYIVYETNKKGIYYVQIENKYGIDIGRLEFLSERHIEFTTRIGTSFRLKRRKNFAFVTVIYPKDGSQNVSLGFVEPFNQLEIDLSSIRFINDKILQIYVYGFGLLESIDPLERKPGTRQNILFVEARIRENIDIPILLKLSKKYGAKAYYIEDINIKERIGILDVSTQSSESRYVSPQKSGFRISINGTGYYGYVNLETTINTPKGRMYNGWLRSTPITLQKNSEKIISKLTEKSWKDPKSGVWIIIGKNKNINLMFDRKTITEYSFDTAYSQETDKAKIYLSFNKHSADNYRDDAATLYMHGEVKFIGVGEKEISLSVPMINLHLPRLKFNTDIVTLPAPNKKKIKTTDSSIFTKEYREYDLGGPKLAKCLGEIEDIGDGKYPKKEFNACFDPYYGKEKHYAGNDPLVWCIIKNIPKSNFEASRLDKAPVRDCLDVFVW